MGCYQHRAHGEHEGMEIIILRSVFPVIPVLQTRNTPPVTHFLIIKETLGESR